MHKVSNLFTKIPDDNTLKTQAQAWKNIAIIAKTAKCDKELNNSVYSKANKVHKEFVAKQSENIGNKAKPSVNTSKTTNTAPTIGTARNKNLNQSGVKTR